MNSTFLPVKHNCAKTEQVRGVRVSLIAGQSPLGWTPASEDPGQSATGETLGRFTLSLVFEDGGIEFDD